MKVGDTLYCKDGSTVVLCFIDDKNLIVEYKGKHYRRPVSAINQTLFLLPVKNGENSLLGKLKQYLGITPPRDADGFDNFGYDVMGFDRAGFDKDGYNSNGFDKAGRDRSGYDQAGYDIEGYGRDGYNVAGFDRRGFNKSGFNCDGFDRAGYNAEGYNRQGFNRYGFNKTGLDKDGFYESGYGIDGYNRAGYDKQGFDRRGFDKSGYNNKGFNKAGRDRSGFDQAGYDAEGYGRDGYNVTGFDKRGFNKSGFDCNGYDRSGYNAEGYNRRGFDRNGYDKSGLDKDGFNKKGFGLDGYNRAGYDVKGFNQQGFDKDGYDREGYNRSGINKKREMKPGLGKEFEPNKTPVYHEIFGAGIFTRFSVSSSNVFFHVKFDQKTEETLFIYPDCIENHIFLNKTKKTTAREHYLNTEYGRGEFAKEENFFNEVCKQIDADKHWAQLAREDEYYNLYRSFDPKDMIPGLVQRTGDMGGYNEATSRLSLVYRMRGQPYFARVDYNLRQGMYIGKHEFGDIVVDWADPSCSIYYEYQMYVGNPEYRLSLVRDFDIHGGVLFGFTDVYNSYRAIYDDEDSATSMDETITDERLLMIIRTQREDKVVHDIIASIQANQYRMITNPEQEEMVVEGCAGSGKTMILLHRLRYLMRNNKQLHADKVYVLAPTDTLNIESDMLANTLQINAVRRLSNVVRYKAQEHWCSLP